LSVLLTSITDLSLTYHHVLRRTTNCTTTCDCFYARGVLYDTMLSLLAKAIIGSEVKWMPTFVIAGLLSSVFSGSMDVVQAWGEVSGPKLVLYHLEDR
jgi:hypothetical protein